MDVAFEGPTSVAPRSIRSIPATDGTAIARGAVSVRKATARVGHVGVYELVDSDQGLTAALQARGEELRRLGRGGVERMLRVREVRVDGKSFTADWWEVGTLDDLSALGWELAKRLELATTIGKILQSIHGAGAAFGALRPDDVLFDDDLEPILGPVTLAGSSDPRDALYTAPETRGGAAPDVRADVFAFGQLLHFILGGTDPVHSDEVVPLLAALTELPAGLSRIVRKATCLDPSMRYPSTAALLADLDRYGSVDAVGLAHANAAEPNRTGLTIRRNAPARPEQALAPPVQRPGSHPVIEAPKPSIGERLRAFRASRAFTPFAAGSLVVVMGCLLASAAGAAGVGRRIEDARLRGASNNERAALVASMHESGRRDFAGQPLAGASLRKAALSHADLGGSDLSGADLGEAQLAYANLGGAKLDGAKLLGADLTGATLDDSAEAARATCDAQTLLPHGWTCKGGFLVKGAAAPAQATKGH